MKRYDIAFDCSYEDIFYCAYDLAVEIAIFPQTCFKEWHYSQVRTIYTKLSQVVLTVTAVSLEAGKVNFFTYFINLNYNLIILTI